MVNLVSCCNHFRSEEGTITITIAIAIALVTMVTAASNCTEFYNCFAITLPPIITVASSSIFFAVTLVTIATVTPNSLYLCLLLQPW